MAIPPFDPQSIVQETFVAAVEFRAELPSTNDFAKQRAAEPVCRVPLLVVAEQQTAGRGRGRNHWWSDSGSLTFSLILDAGRSPLVSLATAVSVVEASEETCDKTSQLAPIGIHWPNDVFAAGRKLCGILVEVLANRRSAIGVGINVNTPAEAMPPEIREKAISLMEITGTVQDPTRLLICFLRRLETWISRLKSAPAEVAARADALCLQHDHVLTVQTAGQTITGRCAGIGPEGQLLLDAPAGQITIHSGTLVG